MSYMDSRDSFDYTCASHSCQFPVYDNVAGPRDDYVTVTAEKADMYGQRRGRYMYRPRRYRPPPRRRRFLPQLAPVSESGGRQLSSTAVLIIIVLLFIAVAGVAALIASLVIQTNRSSDTAEELTTTATTTTTTTTTTQRSTAAAADQGGVTTATGADRSAATQPPVADRSTATQVTGARHYRNSTNVHYFISTTKLDQPTARTECQSMGADLASVSDQAEMDFLISISPQLDTEDYWFGLVKVIGDSWVGSKWYDLNPSTYRDFVPGQPTMDDTTLCFRYTTDGFKETQCSLEYYFACKKDAGL